ncbi:hypothetical protein M413DRAFT_167377 [Hebeloma cylindrosporum]|uniref:Nitrogen regulatory protein areA GATA-like domain-containing protein n=1 Tax=Hebeloma cylindrosporum TaxID=76867 RepID=A0A0C3C957_HEBCY|nr:hypothetical protein M413DRAFT_167377 [Hebeloma cylindrosporum h7]
MVATFPTPVLSVAPDAVRDLQGRDALSGLWTLFTKCKESLQEGRRLENISWRLWYREMMLESEDAALRRSGRGEELLFVDEKEKTDGLVEERVNVDALPSLESTTSSPPPPLVPPPAYSSSMAVSLSPSPSSMSPLPRGSSMTLFFIPFISSSFNSIFHSFICFHIFSLFVNSVSFPTRLPDRACIC